MYEFVECSVSHTLPSQLYKYGIDVYAIIERFLQKLVIVLINCFTLTKFVYSIIEYMAIKNICSSICQIYS